MSHYAENVMHKFSIDNTYILTRVNILTETSYLFPTRVISSPSNLNFGIILPWLEKILNLAPIKCLEMLQNYQDMWKLSN